jgi:hypothetical protein
LPLTAGEQNTGGEVRDGDGRLIVVGPGGVAIGGGGGGTGADPLSDGTPGGALPAKTLWVAGADGTVLRGITVNASGHQLVAVQNFPATQAVSDGGGSLTVDGTVTANAGAGPWPVTDNGGTLSIDDGAGSLTVDGSVSVSNFPASQAVTGTFFQATQPVSGTVTANAGTGPFPVSDNAGSLTTDTPQLPAALVGSRLDVNLGAVGAGLVLPIVGSAPAQSTATWTSATALNTALTYTGLAPYGAVTVGITVPSTVTGGAVTLETSLDGTNWTQAGAVRVDNSYAENVVPLAFFPGTNGTRQYLISLDALTQVRARLSTVIAGTGNVTVIVAPAQQGVEPLVATRARKVPTYQAVYRAATRPYYLDFTFTANTRKQYATIHHAATATKTVRLRRASVTVILITTAATELNFDLVRITTAPATGNPAVTPAIAESSDAAAEATCLALPGTAATEGAVFASQYASLGITGAASTVNPPAQFPRYELITPDQYDDEAKLPTIRAGVLEGWSLTIDSTAAARVIARVDMQFSEE